MALQRLKTDLRAILQGADAYNRVGKILRGLTDSSIQSDFSGKYHFMTIDRAQFATKLRLAVIDALVRHFSGNRAGYEAYIIQHHSKLEPLTFMQAIDDAFSDFTRRIKIGGHASRFTVHPKIGKLYKDTTKTDTLLALSTANIYNRGDKFRQIVYRKWLDNVTAGVGSTVLPGRKVDTQRRGLKVVHDPQNTVWIGFIEFRVEQILAEINFDVEEFDVINAILFGLGVDWKEEPIGTENVGLGQKRIMKVYLGRDNVRNLLDANGIEEIIKAITDTQKEVFWRGLHYMNPFKALKAVASVPFQQQAASAAQYKLLREMMNKNKHHVVKTKIKTKKPNIKPRKAPLRSPRKIGGKISKVSLSKQVKVQRGVEKGQGKEASTSTAAELAKLKKYINSRLPAEVRRNMRRPALQNRTGRFSNSAQLLSLTEAQNTIMAKYTYLLSPYQTFENTGRRRWPLAYNPKPLIAKSIRNLAQGRIEQKLTVRRV